MPTDLRLQRDPPLPAGAARTERTWSSATAWRTSIPARCPGTTATSATRCSRGCLNVLFHTGVRDAHCGMRAFRRDRLELLQLRTTGMEFASEMVVRAAKEGLDIREIPIEYHPRGGESKLSSFRDGWRHLRFLLLHSPNHLFILPGALMAILGGLDLADRARTPAGARTPVGPAHADRRLAAADRRRPARRPRAVRSRLRDVLHGRARRLVRPRARTPAPGARPDAGQRRSRWSALAMLVVIVLDWIGHGFGSLSQERTAIFAATLLVLGIQIVFTSFLLSILGLRSD